jgi:hypothetical protein
MYRDSILLAADHCHTLGVVSAWLRAKVRPSRSMLGARVLMHPRTEHDFGLKGPWDGGNWTHDCRPMVRRGPRLESPLSPAMGHDPSPIGTGMRGMDATGIHGPRPTSTIPRILDTCPMAYASDSLTHGIDSLTNARYIRLYYGLYTRAHCVYITPRSILVYNQW